MEFAHRADAVGTEKFFRIEHAPEQALHPMTARQRDEPPLARAGIVPARNQRGQIRAVFQIPFEASFERRERIE